MSMSGQQRRGSERTDSRRCGLLAAAVHSGAVTWCHACTGGIMASATAHRHHSILSFCTQQHSTSTGGCCCSQNSPAPSSKPLCTWPHDTLSHASTQLLDLLVVYSLADPIPPSPSPPACLPPCCCTCLVLARDGVPWSRGPMTTRRRSAARVRLQCTVYTGDVTHCVTALRSVGSSDCLDKSGTAGPL